MEMEDPLSAKFRTVVETLMIKTTSEVVKVFADVMFETRMEISRSWREINALKQELEQRELQQVDSNFRSQMTQVSFKEEEDDMVVPQESSVIVESMDSRSRVQISEDATVEETNTRQDSVSVLEQATTSSNPETSLSEAPVTHLKRKQKTGHLSTSHSMSEPQTSATETGVLPTSPVHDLSAVSPQQLHSTTDIIILRECSTGKGAVMSKRKYLKKQNSAKQSNSVTRMLRDRQLLSSQKACLCCSSGECSKQEQESKKNLTVNSCVYTCTNCGAKFQKRKEFRSHTCSGKLKCSRCGQTFTSLNTLASHNRRVLLSLKKPFKYKCFLCDHMFATQCGWNIHKRIHAHGHVSDIGQQEIPSPANSFSVPKVEVRLERISQAQLEAALFPKASLLLDDENSLSSKKVSSVVEPTSSKGNSLDSEKLSTGKTMNASNSYAELVKKCQASSSGTESSEGVRQSDDGTEDSVFPNASIRNQPAEKLTQSKSVTAHRIDSVDCDESSSIASNELSKGHSLSRKRKMSDCNHDMYNGVFPVEKILRWRNTKGRNEVRIKWMPCSLCGAKWKNTWEPAESFISYKDGRSEETVNTDKKNKNVL